MNHDMLSRPQIYYRKLKGHSTLQSNVALYILVAS